MQWTVGKIGDALKVGAPFSLVHQRVAGFSIDSRTLKPGQVFFALKGPHHDGHDHVEEALQKRAVVCIVSDTRRMTYPPVLHKNLIGCADTFEALQHLARLTRRTWGRILVGVTGSMGKTTTKEMLAAMLATKYKLLKSEGNLNNEYGVPLTLLRLEPTHELAVLEMAMSHKGELAKLCAVAEPNIGLVTNVAPVHLEFFSSLDDIAEAKRELLQGLAAPAIAVLNADDERVRRFAEGFRGKVLRFGSQNSADVRLENLADNGCLGTEFDLVVGAQRVRARLPLPGRAHATNALAAFAVASLLKVEPVPAAEALAHLQPPPLRGALVRVPAGFTLVNDAYNSNPQALAAMTEALSRTPGARRRIVVAGEMKELGAGSAELHRQAGAAIAALGNIDFLVGVTGEAQHIIEGARAAGLPAERALFFATKEAAAEWLCATARDGDWILVKASRGVVLETLIDAVQANCGAALSAEGKG